MEKIDWEGFPVCRKPHKIKRSLELLYQALIAKEVPYSKNMFEIIEIGASGKWEPGINDGAGYCFNWFCEKYGGKYVAVDLDLQTILLAKKRLPKAVLHHYDGIAWLSTLDPKYKISYLYLDGPSGHEFALRAYVAMQKNLFDYSLLVLDDVYEYYFKQSFIFPYQNNEIIGQSKEVNQHPEAKGRLIVPAMLKDGWIEDGQECGNIFDRNIDFSKPSPPCQEIFYTKRFKEVLVNFLALDMDTKKQKE